jgi:hypothetical protein
MFNCLFANFSIYLKPIVDVKKASLTHQKRPVFWHTLFRTYSDKFIAGGIIKLIHDLVQLSSPMLLK